MCSEIWSQVSPGIVHHVQTLLTKSRIGVRADTLRIIDYGSSCHTLIEGPAVDRFKIIIPYGGHSVTWEILFNHHHPEDPPDFVFSPDDKNFFPEIDNIKSLISWVPRDPYALTNVVCELLDEYKKHQRDIINADSRLQFEYNSLLEQAGMREEDIEIYAVRKSEYRLGPVSFLIRLKVDFSRIPSYMTKDNPGEDTAVLLVTFQSPDGIRITPQLFLSPRVEHALGGPAGLRIPNYPSGSCLIDYVPTVHQLLKNKVDQIVNSFERRREYISAFLSYFGRSVMEYDMEAFSKISFLLEWHDFFFVLTVDLTENFPTEQPSFTFQSVYHLTCQGDGLPFSEVVTVYPYSPRWSPNEMADRARVFILEHAGKFQKTSIKEGSL